ncbi:hypothetical protein GTGU_04109 [Trabulsiella guamensis ATCC 49490]|uniref:DUF5405 domain-containing protein n=1 Tax=Trabulsiella guamensis ATCC 49490 TaxID=1005994 RepID=A0A084ZQC6_9ENTR|nr:DUF5405 family protein [Trabulsiella guamensis]KFB99670.1 hypothetical protein GTGU_04109 [Trabulsiella guamensis ATCC 49490]
MKPRRSDSSDFIDWLWSCEPDLAHRVQMRYSHYLTMQPAGGDNTAAAAGRFIVDGCYRVESDGVNMFLYHHAERDGALLSVYQTPVGLFTDLISHSIRTRKADSVAEFVAEITRLASVCIKAWSAYKARSAG